MRAKLAAMALAALAVGGAMGDTWTDPDTDITWTYTVTDGKASLGGDWSSTAVPESTTGALSIPFTLDVYLVVNIGDSAFFNCTKLV